MAETLDCIVIGAGPAGLQAAIYLSRAGKKVAVVGKPSESGLYKAHLVENYLGVKGESGEKIINNALDQARSFGTKVVEDEAISMKRVSDEPAAGKANFKVSTAANGDFESQTLVIASGAKKASANVAGEKELTGKGVSYCAACDAYFYKGKTVAVIGRHNYAAHEALEIADHAARVAIFTQGKPPEMSEQLKEKLVEKNIAIRSDTITAILATTGKFVDSIKITTATAKEEKTEPIGGVFVAVGTASSSDFASQVGVYSNGKYVEADKDGRTNVPGVFAAGDCTGGRLQLSISVGQGANAAFSALEFLSGNALVPDWGAKA